MRYRYRRHRWGWRGFPIPLFFILFFASGHSWISFLISAGVMVLVFLLLRWLLASTSQPGISGVPPNQRPYQQQGHSPYNEPPAYQPYQPYRPYEQGYQAPQGGYEQSGQEYRYPEQRSEQVENVQYEQPQVQYPQEMPPMEQS